MTRPATDLGWLRLQTQALYREDQAGRLLAPNAFPGDDTSTPRLFVGTAREGLIWRMRADLPASLVAEIARLLGAERAPADLDREPERMAVVRSRLEEHAPIEREWRGPAYRFPPEVALAGEGPTLIEDDGQVAHFEPLAGRLAERAPVFGILEQGEAVSVAYCATPPSEPSEPGGPVAPVEVGVDTLAGYRGRGYASKVVAAWARAIRAGGREPLYSTSVGNRASRAVARKLGLIRYGTNWHLR